MPLLYNIRKNRKKPMNLCLFSIIRNKGPLWMRLHRRRRQKNVRSKQCVGQALRRKEKSEDFYFDPAEGSRFVSLLALNGCLDLFVFKMCGQIWQQRYTIIAKRIRPPPPSLSIKACCYVHHLSKKLTETMRIWIFYKTWSIQPKIVWDKIVSDWKVNLKPELNVHMC